MKQLTSLFLALLTLTATAQINYPFNPDENADAFISTPDLMEFLVVFGYEWEQEEIQVDSIPLSMYLSSLEAMIGASALPEGTMPGQFLQWTSLGIWSCQKTAAPSLKRATTTPRPTCSTRTSASFKTSVACATVLVPSTTADVQTFLRAIATARATWLTPWARAVEVALADEDGDGICDDGDACVGEADECACARSRRHDGCGLL